jgi:hypothetical protein
VSQPNGISVDGNSLVISNATITVENAFDQSNGAAVIIITPAGGLGTLPALLQGQPGLPPVLRNINSTQVPAGTALPDPAWQWTLISPGGPGVAAVYDLEVAINSGATGESGTYSIAGSTDLSGTATNNYTLVWNALENQFMYQPLYIGATYWPTTVSNTSGFTAQNTPRTLTSIAVPALPFAWTPVMFGQTLVTGTVNTVIKLSANLGSVSGQQVGVGFGVPGQDYQTVVLQSGIPAGSAAGYGQVAANSSATVVLSATQTANTTDSWSTSSLTTSFQLTPNPVPPS